MAKAGIYNNGVLAGYLQKTGPEEYLFTYENNYWLDATLPSICLTLPKTNHTWRSSTLFSFFAGLLAEGVNKDIQCRLLKIDEQDDFTRLLKTAGEDTIGAITVKEIQE